MAHFEEGGFEKPVPQTDSVTAPARRDSANDREMPHRAAQSKRLLETAYHEAGHAVVHFLRRLPFEEVSIIPEGDTAGRVKTAHRPDDLEPSYWDRRRVESELMSLYAGQIAAGILRGRRQFYPSQGDMHEAAGILVSSFEDEDERNAYARWIYLRTKSLLRMPDVWRAVEALAQELAAQHRLSAVRARAVIRQTMPEGRLGMIRRWD